MTPAACFILPKRCSCDAWHASAGSACTSEGRNDATGAAVLAVLATSHAAWSALVTS
eukprot:CAMPEP_0172680388 /NCGR_PEP_ID=MMETSP1074-20121228/16736_1 /TAXON_ID=2916 /ORGANISM="Ceratium fusus, Strain PA161109" /LENGTH=56 /DNA_ID=CAMNT_0013498711 /DNA_START=145 /DNA_END=315 /DNA_ORIENTATION=-